jgi:hypothetical protein
LLQPLEAVKDGAAANPPRSPEHEGPDCADLQDDADEASCTKQLCTSRRSLVLNVPVNNVYPDSQSNCRRAVGIHLVR